MEKLLLGLVSILTGISPIIFTYLFKRQEHRSTMYINKSKMDEAARRMDFTEKYLQLQAKILSEDELTRLKTDLSAQLTALKQNVDLLFVRTETAHEKKVSTVQKLFLTYRPASWRGWLLVIVFYLTLMLATFALLGMLLEHNAAVASLEPKAGQQIPTHIIHRDIVVHVDTIVRIDTPATTSNPAARPPDTATRKPNAAAQSGDTSTRRSDKPGKDPNQDADLGAGIAGVIALLLFCLLLRYLALQDYKRSMAGRPNASPQSPAR